jgi:ABC-type Zn uptake system ZnuABC Zn-binding protein ZnuA
VDAPELSFKARENPSLARFRVLWKALKSMKMQHRISIALWLCLLIGWAEATMGFTSPVSAGNEDATLQLAVSTPIFADIVSNVAGSRAEVWSIIPEEADPHTYEAVPADLIRLTDSDAFIYMGANLEPFIESGAWRRQVASVGLPVLELAAHLNLVEVDKVIDHGDHVHDLREGDPHVWLDPAQVLDVVDTVEAFLVEIDPAGAEDYAAHAVAYRMEVEELDRELTEQLGQIPSENRKLVVFHDAYTYFAARYGFEVIGVVLNNPEAEPSAREMVELLEVIEEHDVSVIFAEPQFNTGFLERLAEEASVQVGELLTDAFVGRVDSYLDLMRFNLASLMEHLGR